MLRRLAVGGEMNARLPCHHYQKKDIRQPKQTPEGLPESQPADSNHLAVHKKSRFVRASCGADDGINLIHDILPQCLRLCR
jgi:hypothetical protein